MNRRPVSPRLFPVLAVLAVALVGLPATPARAEPQCSSTAAAAWFNLTGFPTQMSNQQPRFYYTAEGADSSFTIQTFMENCGAVVTASVAYDTPSGATNGASPGADYTRATGRWEVTSSSSQQHYGAIRTVPVDVHQDTNVEAAAEEVSVRLSDPNNGFLSEPSQAPLFIVDDDGSSRARFVTSSRTVAEAATTLKIPVILAGPASTAPVNFSVSPASSSDLEPTSGSVAWASGGRLGIVSLSVKGDSVCENQESFTISLSGASTAAPHPFTLTINDNDCGGGGGTTQRTLTVTKDGSGNGTVTSSPAGISCGSDCTQAYADGTSVTLTAAPASGSTFGGWSGGGCSGTSTTCTVTMNQNRTVNATFRSSSTTSPGTLSVTKLGNAADYGTVTSSPAGIDCGQDCSQPYSAGAEVTLTASPARLFTGWAGHCTATSTTCTVTINGDRAVAATFEDVRAPRAWFHHPDHGKRYRKGSFNADTVHVFVKDNAGRRAVDRTLLALRRKRTNGNCQYWKGGAWRSGACGSPKWLQLTRRYPDIGRKWLYIYDAYPSLRPSVGTRIANYTVFTRSTDVFGNTSRLVTGESRNTFEVRRR